ncbi:MAG: Hpt domain-containing protein, partial [Magnetococcales bacterium]|nr:Hpt domain-containing protein [Magnetococcales bacterium]
IGDREKSLAAGMNDHLSKPINKKELFESLMRWVAPVDRNKVPIPLVNVNKTDANIDDSATFDHIPGIDVKTALDNLDGNHKLFHTLLIEFERSVVDIPDKIGRALSKDSSDDDLKSAEILAHSVKGMAGNMAADGLFDAARVLEQGIRERDREKWLDLLTKFEEKLEEIVTGIAALKLGQTTDNRQKAETTNVQNVDLDLVTPHLHKLSVLLGDNNVLAQGSVDNLKPLLVGGEFAEWLRQLEDSLDSFDFGGAMEPFLKICNTLGVEVVCDDA